MMSILFPRGYRDTVSLPQSVILYHNVSPHNTLDASGNSSLSRNVHSLNIHSCSWEQQERNRRLCLPHDCVRCAIFRSVCHRKPSHTRAPQITLPICLWNSCHGCGDFLGLRSQHSLILNL